LDGVDFLAPAGALRLTVASTVPEARGQGVSSTLLGVALQDAYARGYRVCETDWRITNLLSSRHWEGKGFKEVAKRLVRKVDQRIVWADGYNELP
jgi:GNAT superfamily N-acetyltransferase